MRQTAAIPDDNREIAEKAVHIRLAVTRTARRLRQEAGGELSPTNLAALATVDRHGPLTPSRLAEIEGVKRPTATKTAQCLTEKGFVTGITDPEDRRRTLLEVTPEGREFLRERRSRKSAFLARFLETLPAEEVETLERAASILERALEEGRAPGPSTEVAS